MRGVRALMMETVMRLQYPVVACALVLAAQSALAANIVEEWSQVKAPPAPILTGVTVKAADTALLLLDIEEATCNPTARPRCVEVVPGIATFLARAREAHLPVFYSNTRNGTRETMLKPVAPRDDEPIVKASVNKFFGTQLDELLKAKGIKTVIVCGTTAAGAVLHTATAAAQYGYKIIQPVDCMPAASQYEEQASLWSLINGPATRPVLTPTALPAIRIE